MTNVPNDMIAITCKRRSSNLGLPGMCRCLHCTTVLSWVHPVNAYLPHAVRNCHCLKAARICIA